jgi:ComF family protein
MKIKELAHSLIHLFYPRLCEGCAKPLMPAEEVLCISCAAHLPRTEFHHIPGNEAALRLAGRIPYVHATSFAYFTNDGLLQHLLHQLKYRGRKEVGIYLGRQFAYDLQQSRWQPVDYIIPVPLHRKKEAVRGYNQSLLIAEGLSRVLKAPVAADILLRPRHTESQTKKTRTERLKNMENAFQVNKNGKIVNKHILLVDDVLTTGATLEACALALLKTENIKISIAVVGIAVS